MAPLVVELSQQSTESLLEKTERAEPFCLFFCISGSLDTDPWKCSGKEKEEKRKRREENFPFYIRVLRNFLCYAVLGIVCVYISEMFALGGLGGFEREPSLQPTDKPASYHCC